MIILIPAYEPDDRLLRLIDNLFLCQYSILIVDDGSGPAYQPIFQAAQAKGCTVLHHSKNKGKGRALKTGFAFIEKLAIDEGVVCADSDGQHLPKDIERIAHCILTHPGQIILGSRSFTGKVPLRSSFGNTVTRWFFKAASGISLSDTQTGLRGFSKDMLPWLGQIPGEHFEYEMNMLLYGPKSGYTFHCLDIQTIYPENHHSSHFNPILDSIRIYLPIIKFCFSSLISAFVDFILLMVFQPLLNDLFLAVVLARICSATINYTLNRQFVFSLSSKSSIKSSLPRYTLLAGTLMFANYGFIYFFNVVAHIPLFFAKIAAEITLYGISYIFQRKFVFSC